MTTTMTTRGIMKMKRTRTRKGRIFIYEILPYHPFMEDCPLRLKKIMKTRTKRPDKYGNKDGNKGRGKRREMIAFFPRRSSRRIEVS